MFRKTASLRLNRIRPTAMGAWNLMAVLVALLARLDVLLMRATLLVSRFAFGRR